MVLLKFKIGNIIDPNWVELVRMKLLSDDVLFLFSGSLIQIISFCCSSDAGQPHLQHKTRYTLFEASNFSAPSLILEVDI